MLEMKKAVDLGYWNLYRYNPKTGLSLDFEPNVNTLEFLSGERRFASSMAKNPALLEENNTQAKQNLELLKKLANKE